MVSSGRGARRANPFLEATSPTTTKIFKERKGAPIEASGGIYALVRKLKEEQNLLEKNGQGKLKGKERRKALELLQAGYFDLTIVLSLSQSYSRYLKISSIS